MELRLKGNEIILAALVVFSTWWRFDGIDYGLPHRQAKADESPEVNFGVYFGAGHLNPQVFERPSTFRYSLTFIYGVIYLAGRLAGLWRDSGDFEFLFFTNPMIFYLSARMMVAILGSWSVLLLYRIVASQVSCGAALAAAFLLGTCHLHVVYSHFIVTEILVLFLLLLILQYCLKFEGAGERRYLTWASLLFGLAVGVKYNAGVFGFMLLISFWRTRNRHGTKVKWSDSWRIFLLPLVAFFLTNPFALIAGKRFVEEFLWQVNNQAEGGGERGWIYQLHTVYPRGLGWPLTLACLFSLPWFSLSRRYRHLWVFPLWAVVYFFAMGATRKPSLVYYLPILPGLLAPAAAAWGEICLKLKAKWGAAGTGLAVFLLLGLTYFPLRESLALNGLFNKKDTRLAAREWIETNVPAGAAIYMTGWFYKYQRVELFQTRDSLKRERDIVAIAKRGHEAKYFRSRQDEIMAHMLNLPGYSPRPAYQVYFGADWVDEELAGNIKRLKIAYVILALPPFPDLEMAYPLSRNFLQKLREKCKRLARFSPFPDEQPIPRDEVFFAPGLDYFPFTGAKYFARGGPILEIYKVEESAF